MKIYRCMHDLEAICYEHGRQLLLIWFINYLPLTKFHIVNRVWAISTLIITSCCTCHNYICNLFLNGILVGASMSCGHFSSQIILFLFGIQIAAVEDVHPKSYPVPCLPPSLPPPPLTSPPPHIHHDQDFKVIVLIFYLIDKREFR